MKRSYFLIRCGIQYIEIFLCTNRCCKTCWWCSTRTCFQIISKDLHYWDCSMGSDWKQKWPCWKRCKDKLPNWNNDLPDLLFDRSAQACFFTYFASSEYLLYYEDTLTSVTYTRSLVLNKLQNANVLEEELVLKYLILPPPDITESNNKNAKVLQRIHNYRGW